MRFTAVLITQPSRTHYLEESLKNLVVALNLNPNMDLLVIFNGKSKVGESILKPLIKNNAGRVRFRVIQKNSPLPDQFLSIIREEELRWIHLPGDDDLVIPESYAHFAKALDASPDSVAVAFSAYTIDANGAETGKVLRPFNWNKTSKSVALANALHRPPFVWPSLIFDFWALPRSTFASRFVFDWWVGLNLLLAGQVQVVRVPLIQYRIHPNQESFQTTENRKRFEAEIMLSTTLFQEKAWLMLHKMVDRRRFLAELAKRPPIYGDPKFGAAIYFMLQKALSEGGADFPSPSPSYNGIFAEQHGVLMNLQEFPGLSLQGRNTSNKFNFRLDIREGTCPSVRKALEHIFDLSDITRGEVGCLHSAIDSRNQVAMIRVDCVNLQREIQATSIEDLLCHQIESQLDSVRTIGTQTAFWETVVIQKLRNVLQFMRRARSIVPAPWRR